MGAIFSFLLLNWPAWGDEGRGNGGLGLVKLGLIKAGFGDNNRMGRQLKTLLHTLDCMLIISEMEHSGYNRTRMVDINVKQMAGAHTLTKQIAA